MSLRTGAVGQKRFGQTISSFQAVQHALVEMHTLETGMHLFVENALSALEKSGDSTQEVCMAKYFCAEKLRPLLSTLAARSRSRKCSSREKWGS